MITGYIEGDRETLEKLRAEVDARLGWKPIEGTDVGEGIHVPADMSRTTERVAIMVHPDNPARCAIQVDSESAKHCDDYCIECVAKLGKGATPIETKVAALPLAAPLDTSWLPPDMRPKP